MIPSATADIRLFPTAPPFLPFWAWSVILHIGVMLLLSLLHATQHLERAPSRVNVTLIDTSLTDPSTPSPAASEPEATPKEEAYPVAPPQLEARRSTPTVPQPSIPTSQLLPMPEIQTTVAQIPTPALSTDSIPQMSRRVLRDQHATNNLNLKNLLMVPRRASTSHTNSQKSMPPSDLLAVATVPSAGIPSTPSSFTPRRVAEPTSRALTPDVMKAAPPGTGRISGSKVGLGRTIPPVYPRIARESGWEGTVLVRVAVQPDGLPDSIQVRKSSGYPILDEAALDAVKKWRFLPAKDGNIPIRSVVEIPINFDLRKQG